MLTLSFSATYSMQPLEQLLKSFAEGADVKTKRHLPPMLHKPKVCRTLNISLSTEKFTPMRLAMTVTPIENLVEVAEALLEAGEDATNGFRALNSLNLPHSSSSTPIGQEMYN